MTRTAQEGPPRRGSRMHRVLALLCARRGGATAGELRAVLDDSACKASTIGSVLCQLRDRGWVDGPTGNLWFPSERALAWMVGEPAGEPDPQYGTCWCGEALQIKGKSLGAYLVCPAHGVGCMPEDAPAENVDSNSEAEPASDGPGIGEPPVEKDPLRASADALLAGGAGGGNGHGTLAKQGPGAGRPAPPLTDAAACIDFAHEAAIRAMEARVHAVGDAQLTALWHGLKSVAYAAKLAIREE